MKKEMFTLSSVTVWTNTLTWFYSSLSLSPSESRQRWPVAFWNLSTISVGPLEPVLDSGGGYDSSAASSIILSSRVNLLSSWNGPEPFYTDPIRSCFSHELGIPTRITFSFLFLSRSSLSQSSRLSIILSITLYNTRSPGKQNFTRYHRSKFQTRLSKIIGVFRINIIRHLFARVGLFRIVINLKGVSNSLKNREKKMRKF